MCGEYCRGREYKLHLKLWHDKERISFHERKNHKIKCRFISSGICCSVFTTNDGEDELF
jgi:hypothetical protein